MRSLFKPYKGILSFLNDYIKEGQYKAYLHLLNLMVANDIPPTKIRETVSMLNLLLMEVAIQQKQGFYLGIRIHETTVCAEGEYDEIEIDLMEFKIATYTTDPTKLK